MSTTYLQAVNDVLLRLREDTVSTVALTNYSQLIGKFVNDAKRQVENAFNWNALRQTISVNTVAGTSNYTLTGAGQNFRVEDVFNTTAFLTMANLDGGTMYRYLNFGSQPQSVPTNYAFSGTSNGDSKVDIWPKPDGVYALKFNLFVPSADLSSDSDTLKVAEPAIMQLAYARALVERGEDGGMSSSEAYALGRAMLSDYIAMEGTNSIENQMFVAV
jgi:hypothetical protein